MAPTEIAECCGCPPLENVPRRAATTARCRTTEGGAQKYLLVTATRRSTTRRAHLCGRQDRRARRRPVSTTRAVFNAVVLRQRTFAEAQQQGAMTVTAMQRGWPS
jgi:hypothetical protein